MTHLPGAVPPAPSPNAATQRCTPHDRVALAIAAVATVLGLWLGLVAPGVSPVTPVTPVTPVAPVPAAPAVADGTP